jgi:hypothetical protein
LQTLYNQHSYVLYHVWNLDEIGIQVPRHVGVKALVKRKSNVVYNIIPKSQEWLTINCVLNATRFILLRFYIFRGKRLRDDYIKLYKLGICMAIFKKTMDDFFLV